MYQFAPEARKALEAMPLPIAYYQRVGDGIVAILVSDGLCMMMGADADAKHPGESCVQGEDPADDTVADDTAIEVDDSELPF